MRVSIALLALTAGFLLHLPQFRFGVATAFADEASLCSPGEVMRLSEFRRISAEDLLKIRDVGGLAASPSGAYLAYQVHQADAVQNTYHSAWCFWEARSGRVTVASEHLGDPMLTRLANGRPQGAWKVAGGRWSPDSSAFAYIAHENGKFSIWLAFPDGRRLTRLSNDNGVVEDLTWSSDGATILYREDAPLATAEEERGGGYIYDSRFYYYSPFRPAHAFQRKYHAIDVRKKSSRAATAQEIELFEVKTPQYAFRKPAARLSEAHPNAWWHAAQPNGRRQAWLEPVEASLSADEPRFSLYSSSPTQGEVRCRAIECVGVRQIWVRDNETVLFSRTSYLASIEVFEVYAWTPGNDAVRLLISDNRTVHGCSFAAQKLFCVVEGAARPAQIFALDTGTGAFTRIIDLNPEYERIHLPRARPVSRQIAGRSEFLGYLVMPPDKSDGPVPLVVVQYRAHGFLRGGIGDEYPIYLLASRGLAVFVFQFPRDDDVPNDADRTINVIRKRFTALTDALDIIESTEAVDATKVGITGLSAGHDLALYALIHSTRFKAAALSSLEWSPMNNSILPKKSREINRARGFGSVKQSDGRNWSELSLAMNIEHLRTPILVQTADHEVLLSVENFSVLEDANYPIEMHVFPDEYHIKWQPRHRLVIYERNVDWLRFWLQEYEDVIPQKIEQYARWHHLRDLARAYPAAFLVRGQKASND